MYRIFLSVLLLASSMPVIAAERTVVTQMPYYNSYYAPHAYYGGEYIPPSRMNRNHRSVFSDINNLERYAMNRNFTRDNDRTRLERLETLAFGAVQEGDIYTRYNNARNAILSRPKQNYKTSLLQSISNYFNGQLTGCTPSITPDISSDLYSYPSDFSQSSSTEYITPWGRGYKTNNYSTGTGSGVRILD